MKRIIFSYVSTNSGHKIAADAVKDVLQQKSLESSFLEIDALGYFSPVIKGILLTSYLELIKSDPYVWEYLYDNPKLINLTVKLKEILNTLKSERLKKKILNGFQPDVVVCTHAFPCGVFSALKKTSMNGLPLIAITTDFDIHAYWLYENVSHYLVANSEIADKLIHHGIPAKNISVTGIPISNAFSNIEDKQIVRNRLQLEELPTILIMGGNYGLGSMEKIVAYLNLLPQLFQIIVVTGKNKSLQKRLERLTKQIERPMKIYGFVHNIHELMQASDILISKPGGLTSAESLCCGLPMIIVNPIPGQEDRNSSYLVKHDAAIRVSHENEVDDMVNNLLRKPEILKRMQENALHLAKPDAAVRAGEIIMSF
ncbi:glycosyltransferase [Candidatus Desantisbacteria bacterium]|nr:glycosyltransferase [Candidatus Desantisbacteria bacterium]